jgi:hypothetical protein
MDKASLRRIPISIKIFGKPGEHLLVEAADLDGNAATARSESPLEAAKKSPLNKESACAELGALGGTIFCISECSFLVEGECFVHTRELKKIRREICEQLTSRRMSRQATPIMGPEETIKWIASNQLVQESPVSSARLNVLVRQIEQLDQQQS